MGKSKRSRVVLPMSLVAVMVAMVAMAAEAQGRRELRPFSPEERRAIIDGVLGAERVVAFAKGQRVRALSVVPQQVEKDGTPAVVAVAVLVNYGSGDAVRVTIDPATARVQAFEPLKGRPQSSLEERQEGEELVRKNPDASVLLTPQVRIEGGFVVDPPAGQPAQGRYLEFHLVTGDGRAFVAEVIVDLGRGRVAGIRRQPVEQKGGGS